MTQGQQKATSAQCLLKDLKTICAFVSPLFPKQCGHCGALPVRVEGRHLIEVSRVRVRLVRCYLQYKVTPLEIFEVHFDCAGSQNLGGWSGRLSRLRSRCSAVRILGRGGQFSWQAQRKPRACVVPSRLFVTGARDRSGFTSMCRFRGQRHSGNLRRALML